jgi:hypothetical protein
MASNEADVIEAFVRHNLRFLDAVVVLEHASVDDTRRILASLVREGLPVVALSDEDRAFRQGLRQTQLAQRFLREQEADFCFALDADEFIKCESRQKLEEALRKLPISVFGLVRWQNYIPDPDGGQDANVLRRITLREESQGRAERKVVLSRRFLDGEPWQVALGNHFAIRVQEGRGEIGDHREIEGVFLAHFPVRSASQITKKAILGWLAHRLTNPDQNVASNVPGVPTPAWHWGEIFRAAMTGETFDGAKLQEIALKYYTSGESPPEARAQLVRDPVPAAFELRYSPAVEMPPLVAVSRWSDRLIADLLQPRAT